MTTPRLGAPELVSGQATPETTVNEQIRYIESGSGHFIFKSRVVATPPGSPADGDCYLVAASGTGAWSGHDGAIAFRVNTAWAFITAIEGFTAWVNDENVFIGYDGAAWNVLASPSGSYQPLDADLTAIAALTGTGTIYYRSAANTWTAVTIGSNLTFTGGTLAASGLSGALLVANNLSDVASAATSRTNLGVAIGSNVQAWDADLDAIAALAGTNTIYYRSAANTWSPITIGSGVAFSGGTLSATGASVTYAAASDIWTGTATTKPIAPDQFWAAAATIALTDAATVTPDGSTGINFKWTMAGSRTLANPTNMKTGQSGLIIITQDATGSRVITYGSNWKFPGGAAAGGVLSTAPNAVDVISYYVRSDGTILCALSKAFS